MSQDQQNTAEELEQNLPEELPPEDISTPPPQEEETDGAAPLLDAHDIESLPVRLECQLAQLETTMGELRRLAAGMILPLENARLQNITLKQNGTPLAQGTLMRLEDETLALKINTINAPQNNPNEETEEPS